MNYWIERGMKCGQQSTRRLAVWNLRQGEARGWLPQLTRRLSLETGIPVQFESSGTPLVLGAESERSLLMIIREAIQNALRHKAPQHLSVTLGFDRRSVQVDIEDDGCGFATANIESSNGSHYGLLGMRERAEAWRQVNAHELARSPERGST